jgi:1,4-alpha-glucan branching enzyme
VAGVAPGDEYRFSIVNDPRRGPDNPGGVFERVDPYARDVTSADAVAPAIVTVPPTPVHRAFPADLVIYQLHIGSFAGLNDGIAVVNRRATFRQIADHKLARIAELGFTAVEFLLLEVVNLGGNRFSGDYRVSLAGDGGRWLEIFNSQSPVYGGFHDSGNFAVFLDGSSGEISIRLPEWSVLVFEKQ